jgi:hypothetical protein
MKTDPLLIVQELANYRNTGYAELLEKAELYIGEHNLRMICVRLLSWMTGGMNYPGWGNRKPPVKLRVMRLHELRPYKEDFEKLVCEGTLFTELLEIGPEGVSLHREIDTETQNKIREKARELTPFKMLDSKTKP